MANKKILQAVTAISKPGFIVEEKTFDSNANVLRLKISIPEHNFSEKLDEEGKEIPYDLKVQFNSKFNYDYIFWGDNTYSTTFIFEKDNENNIIIQNNKPIVKERKAKNEWKYEHTYKIAAAATEVKYEIVITNLSTTPLVKENANLNFFISDQIQENSVVVEASLVEINCGNNIKFDAALFNGVATLTKIIGLNEVSKDCFNGCTALSQVIFDDDFYSMGANAFNGCSNLTKLFISSNLVNWNWNTVPDTITIYYRGAREKGEVLLSEQANVYYYTWNAEDRKKPGNYWYYTEDGLIAEVTVNTQ